MSGSRSGRILRNVGIGRLLLPLGDRKTRLAAAQLRPANGEKRQLHGRAQARELGARKPKLHAFGIVVVTQDVMSPLYSKLATTIGTSSCRKRKELPLRTWRSKPSSWNVCSKNRSARATRGPGTSRHGNMPLLSGQRNSLGTFRIVLPLSLLSLLASNPGEGLAKVGVGALGVRKRTIQDRFHRRSRAVVCDIRTSARPAAASCVPDPSNPCRFSELGK